MKWKQLVAVAVLGGSSALAAIAAPSTPTAPATRPTRQVPEDRRPRVLVMPFTELSDEPKREWVGKAMQQSLVAELTRSGMVSVITPPANAVPTDDAAGAAKLARDQHAPLAVIGSYQLVGEELRVTGQMIESINGEHIAAIKATGSLRDLFGIEDIIGSQVRRDLQVILQPEVASSDPRSSGAGAGDPFGVESTGPVQRQTPRGSYNGSDLQRSLGDDEWNPQPGSYAEERRNRYQYDYPATYYPPYSYYDWCGYNYYTPWRPPLIGHPVVPAGPGSTRTNFPQNNYNTVPGQMGRTSSNNNFNSTPGQMNRSSGNTNYNNHPGQMGRTSGGNAVQSSPGQVGRTSGSSSQAGPSGQSGRTDSSSGSVSRSSGSSSSGNASRSAVAGSSGNASRSTGSSSGNASRSTGSSSGNASQR
jgi:TolB-like protein